MTGRTEHRGWKKDRPRGVPSRPAGLDHPAAKVAGGIVCQDCGIFHHAGRWYFGTRPDGQLVNGVCPACQRVREKYPAGTLRIPDSLLTQRETVLALIRHVEAAEKAEHPLERLMWIAEADGHLVVTTTGVHLAREIAHKLAKQFHEKPRFRYADGEELVHVDWEVRNV
jgi:hypothetical protein